jgi:hypothetical protein
VLPFIQQLNLWLLRLSNKQGTIFIVNESLVDLLRLHTVFMRHALLLYLLFRTQPHHCALQDIESYTSLSQRCEAEDVMNMLHTLFSVFDALTTKHGVFKVETIGEHKS